jgi:N-acyl homoserine lactone hydrolase
VIHPKIYPLHLGTIERFKMTFGYWLEPGIKEKFPIIAWYIKTPGKNILVDTGGTNPNDDHGRNPYHRDDSLHIKNALEKHGLRCEDIHTIILTHLHWDHCGGVDFFPNAEIIIQEDELKYARNPYPVHKYGFVKEIADAERYTIITGDRPIVDNIKVLFTPGHTYGSQSVLVEADQQKYLIAGDMVGLFECIDDRDPPLISGIYVDLKLYYQSLEKIKQLFAFVLPGHDFKVFDKKVYE